jgi:hypothetical protein
MYKVRIKKLPAAKQGRSVRTGQQSTSGALAIQPTAMGGADINQYIGKKDTTVKSSLNRVPREEANLEAEGGETAYGDINGDGMLEHYTINGPRHNAGGVPLNLPDDSFIYSDFVEMKIKDPDLLAKFGKSVKSKSTKGYTPADLAKQYDINKYRKLLQDPNSDTLDKKTAEIMLKNYNMKLGALALAQEGTKAFPQGIPEVSKPFMELNGIKEEDLIPKKPEPAPTQMPSGEAIAQAETMMPEQPMAMYGMQMGGFDMPFMNDYKSGGSLQQYQKKGQVQPPYSEAEGYSPQGVERLNKYRRMYGLPQLKGSLTKADIQKAAGELQSKIIDTNPELVLDYMSRTSHQPNKALLDKMPSGYDKTTEGVRQAFEEGKLSADDVRKAYKDDKWWYRALETDIKELGKEEYEAKMNEDGSITQGDKIYFQDDPDNPQLYTEYVMKDGEPVATEVVKTKEEISADRPDVTNPEFAQNAPATAPEWMTPDLMNYYGALQDQYGINKYYGWSPKADLAEKTGNFLDVTRAAAGIGEQANITGAGLAQFVGSPQTANVMALSSQGAASKNIADLMSQYDNANVGIANQLEDANTNIMNQESEINRGITKQLYDQNTVTNQNYDNALNQAQAAKRLAFNTGWKNASELDGVNETSTEYDIDPSTGDSVFTGGKDLSPELARDFNYYLDMYINDYGMDDDQAIKAANSAMKGTTGSYTPNFDDLLKVQKGMMVSGPMMYPFIL